MSNWLRVFFLGGLTSYRALFGWLNPWIFIPILLVYPLFQILFFVYLGRGADVESDSFFLVGNALQTAAVPGLFAMAQVMGNERFFQTLPTLLASPASRLALFLGRSLPRRHQRVRSFSLRLPPRIACARHPRRRRRDPHDRPRNRSLQHLLRWVRTLPRLTRFAWTKRLCPRQPRRRIPPRPMRRQRSTRQPPRLGARTLSQILPLTHGVEAARDAINGEPLSQLTGLIGTEAIIGFAYFTLGILMLRVFEHEGRRTASLETM